MTPSHFEHAGPEALIDPLAYLTYSRTAQYRTGQKIYVGGEPPGAMFLVLHGNVILTRRTGVHSGLLTICQGGDFFGEGCLLSGFTNHETAVAFEATTVMTWTPRQIQKMCDDSPSLALSLMQRQVLRSMELVNRIETLSSDLGERRLIRALLAFCDCFGEEDGTGWVRLKTISRKLLAECTGMSLQCVTTEMSSLQDQKLLDLSWGAMSVHVAELAKCLPPAREVTYEGGLKAWTPPVRFFAFN